MFSAPTGDLAGKKVVVSAGGTHEPIDPVRFVGNRSSGKMGFALAEAARDRGAEVILVSGPAALPDPVGVEVVRVERAAEMRDAVLASCEGADALIMAAAVADYQPAETVGEKIKRQESEGVHAPAGPDAGYPGGGRIAARPRQGGVRCGEPRSAGQRAA